MNKRYYYQSVITKNIVIASKIEMSTVNENTYIVFELMK